MSSSTGGSGDVYNRNDGTGGRGHRNDEDMGRDKRGRGKRRPPHVVRHLSSRNERRPSSKSDMQEEPDIEIQFKDILFTKSLAESNSDHKNLRLMRQYQLLSALLHYSARKLTDYQSELVIENLSGIERAIQQIWQSKTATVKDSKVKVVGLWDWNSESESNPRPAAQAIHDAIQMCPTTNSELMELTDKQPNQAPELTRNLDDRLSTLDLILSIIYDRELGITGEMVFPPTTVAWRLDDSEISSSRQADEDGDGDGDEYFFPDHPMNTVEDEETLLQFRGIVKLVLTWEVRSGWRPTRLTSRATGWLLDAESVVTAGHCVHKRDRHLVAVEVIQGYDTPDCKSRQGTHVVAHWGYFRDYEAKHDLALIRVNKFESGGELKWVPTPSKGDVKILVAGYPGYASEEMKDKGTKKNKHMQKSEDIVECVTANKNGILRHYASTWGGSSGSPVLNKNNEVIAVHTSWRMDEDRKRFNSAATLDNNANNLELLKRTLMAFAKRDDTKFNDGAVYLLNDNGEEKIVFKRICTHVNCFEPFLLSQA